MNKKITENDMYAKLRKEREELYKIIGKEEITDQKVRIDKYAHLYVLQDEMTEYLRARRLSQAEIEKLYAVENFYEYIQNYLLHHKDVFNYPYQKDRWEVIPHTLPINRPDRRRPQDGSSDLPAPL